jgi:hypothetical protein
VSYSEVTATDVRTALNTYLERCADLHEEPVSEPYAFHRELGKMLRMDYTGLPRGVPQWNAEKKFQQQVTRMLNVFAEDGILVKTGKRPHIHFYTPDAFQVVAEQYARQQQENAEQAARISGVKERLRALGFEPSVSHYPVRLETGDWEKLLDLAENGLALRRGNG